MNHHGRILGIDYGHRRIGLALSDPLRIIAQSFLTIKVTSIEQVLTELASIIQQNNVTEIVVGLPLNLKGERGAAAQQVDQFIQQLTTRFELPVHPWDERWTTLAAQRTILELGKSPSRHKEKVDQISASLILQSFLDHLSFKTQRSL